MNSSSLEHNKAIAQKLAVGRKVVIFLRRKLGKQLIAAGICGSVARGTAEAYSDVDLIAVVKKYPMNLPSCRIVDATYCSIDYVTQKGALSQLTQPSDELPQILGGYGRILPIYDPSGLLQKLEEVAASVPAEVFRKSAELALLHSFEDFCRIKNAFLREDEIVMRDNVYIVTNSAANIVASLNHAAFVSDGEIFKAHRKFRKLPRDYDRIAKLRYGNLKGRALFKTLLEFYLDLIEFCKREGIDFAVDERILEKLR